MLRAADLAGETPAILLDKLLNDFLEDLHDAKLATEAYQEFIDSGEPSIPLDKVLANGL